MKKGGENSLSVGKRERFNQIKWKHVFVDMRLSA